MMEWNGIHSITYHSIPFIFYKSKQWNLILYHSIPLHSTRFHQSKQSRNVVTMVSNKICKKLNTKLNVLNIRPKKTKNFEWNKFIVPINISNFIFSYMKIFSKFCSLKYSLSQLLVILLNQLIYIIYNFDFFFHSYV
jgi:hypothetical protein